MTFNDPPRAKPGATEQEQVYALYKYLLETSAKLNLLQQELSASLTASGVSGASDSTVVDAALSDTSSNPVRNSAVSAALAECARTDDLAAYLPLTGGTLTGSVTVDGSGNALAQSILTDDGYTAKTFLQSAEISDGTYCAQLGYQSGLHGGTLGNWLRMYSGKTVLQQDLQDADGVAYAKLTDGLNMLYLGANPITSTTDDTPAAWNTLGLGLALYSKTGCLTDQPYQYAFLLNITDGTGSVFQMFCRIPAGILYLRGGNKKGWSGTWKQVTAS